MNRACVLLALCIACGGQLAGTDGGSADAGSDTVRDVADEITYDACSGSDGVKLCGGACGQNDCPQTCYPPDATMICIQPDSKSGASCDHDSGGSHSIDGTICVPDIISTHSSAPMAMSSLVAADPGYAILYTKAGFGDFCRYADRSSYDGTPTPDAPASCPVVSGFQLCGGACGECPKGQYCIGRSPLHPYSFCATSYPEQLEPLHDCVRGAAQAGGCYANGAENPPAACLTFKVSDIDQPYADQNGICTDKSSCLAAAAAYPGGAYCTP